MRPFRTALRLLGIIFVTTLGTALVLHFLTAFFVACLRAQHYFQVR